MPQGSIKKLSMGREFLQSVNYSGISGKHSQNQHNTIWRFNKIYYKLYTVIRGK